MSDIFYAKVLQDRLIRSIQISKNRIRFGIARDDCGFDEDGYDEDGYDRFGLDRHGFDRNGIQNKALCCLNDVGREIFWQAEHQWQCAHNEDGRDDAGYDFDGYDRDGYDRNGLDRNLRNRRGEHYYD